jgi:hypothetical protein
MNDDISTTAQQAHALYLELEQCLEGNPGGGSNPEALHKMQSLGLHLKWTSGIFAEKVGSLLGWAAILYSPRKHVRWNSPYQSGAEAVAHHMRCDLASIRIILWRMIDRKPAEAGCRATPF